MAADGDDDNRNGQGSGVTCITPFVGELARVAKDWLTFERLRQELLNQDAQDLLLVHASNRDVEQAVLALFSDNRSPEEIERAYVALMNALSGHPDIAKLKYEDGQSMTGISSGASQAMLKAREDIFARWYDFKEGMERVGTTICKIWIRDQFSGTGFLISERHVLTAYHCIDELIGEGQQRPNSDELLKIVFDNVLIPGQQSSAYRAEFRVSPQWLLYHSKQDPDEDTQQTPLDDVKDGLLDFAVIGLDEPAGNMAPKWRKSIPRGWIDIDKLAAPPNIQAQMLIAHHPGGADLRLCVGLFGKHANKARRVRYQTPTIIGSSGAPCFTVDWRPYALHNAGYPAVSINQGVPLELIRQAIGGSATILTKKKPEDRIIPATTPTGEAILGRDDIAEQIVAVLRGGSSVTTVVITSAPQGGKTYTGELIRSMLIDRGHRAFLFDAEKFAADTPERFAYRLIEECVRSKTERPQPPSPNSRQRARWITRSLTEWTRGSVLLDTPSTHLGAGKSDKTLWVILDRCDVVNFTEETHDLLVALAANEDAGADHALRFVLLGYGKDLASVAPEKVWRTNLDLISVAGILPFMAHTLDTLSITEDSETRKSNAANWIAAASDFGIVTIPSIINGLNRWAETRGATGRTTFKK
jgi:Trypsin-like peptidase domain